MALTEEQRRRILTNSQIQAPTQGTPGYTIYAPPEGSLSSGGQVISGAVDIGTSIANRTGIKDPYKSTKEMAEKLEYLQSTGYSPDASKFNIPDYLKTQKRLEGGIATAGQGIDAQYGGAQKDLIGALQRRSEGLAPSVAELQMQQGLQSGLASNFALANSMRGNPAASARRALASNAALSGQIAGQGAILRAGEQAQAEQLLGSQIGQGRQQALAEQQVVNQLIQYYTSAGMQLDQAQLAANIELEKMRQSGSLQQQAIAGQQTPGGGGGGNQWIGPAIIGGATLGAAAISA